MIAAGAMVATMTGIFAAGGSAAPAHAAPSPPNALVEQTTCPDPGVLAGPDSAPEAILQKQVADALPCAFTGTALEPAGSKNLVIYVFPLNTHTQAVVQSLIDRSPVASIPGVTVQIKQGVQSFSRAEEQISAVLTALDPHNVQGAVEVDGSVTFSIKDNRVPDNAVISSSHVAGYQAEPHITHISGDPVSVTVNCTNPGGQTEPKCANPDSAGNWVEVWAANGSHGNFGTEGWWNDSAFGPLQETAGHLDATGEGGDNTAIAWTYNRGVSGGNVICWSCQVTRQPCSFCSGTDAPADLLFSVNQNWDAHTHTNNYYVNGSFPTGPAYDGAFPQTVGQTVYYSGVTSTTNHGSIINGDLSGTGCNYICYDHMFVWDPVGYPSGMHYAEGDSGGPVWIYALDGKTVAAGMNQSYYVDSNYSNNQKEVEAWTGVHTHLCGC
jgi:hypothetical protein